MTYTDEPLVTDRTPRSCCHCGAPMAAAMAACPRCGRQQMRVCFCGVRLPADTAECPTCGTPWARVVRVRRRSRGSRLRPVPLLKRAATGAAVAAGAALLLNFIISSLAEISADDGGLPAGLGTRLHFAWHTVADGTRNLLSRLAGPAALPVLVLAAVGAVAGAAWYLLEVGRLPWPKGLPRGRRRHSSRRRERTT